MENGSAALKHSLAVPQLNTELPYDPTVPLLGIYPGETKTHVHTKTQWEYS